MSRELYYSYLDDSCLHLTLQMYDWPDSMVHKRAQASAHRRGCRGSIQEHYSLLWPMKACLAGQDQACIALMYSRYSELFSSRLE